MQQRIYYHEKAVVLVRRLDSIAYYTSDKMIEISYTRMNAERWSREPF